MRNNCFLFEIKKTKRKVNNIDCEKLLKFEKSISSFPKKTNCHFWIFEGKVLKVMGLFISEKIDIVNCFNKIFNFKVELKKKLISEIFIWCQSNLTRTVDFYFIKLIVGNKSAQKKD